MRHKLKPQNSGTGCPIVGSRYRGDRRIKMLICFLLTWIANGVPHRGLMGGMLNTDSIVYRTSGTRRRRRRTNRYTGGRTTINAPTPITQK